MTACDLIVNADDFGRSAATNAGIVRAHERGIVTSASLMVCWPAAEEAAAYACAHGQLSVGLHLDLDDPHHRTAEIPRQLERFRELLDRDPTHLDSHHHAHREILAVRELGDRLGIPVRDFGPIRYEGGFYGAVEPADLIALIEQLSQGTTELGCHPGLDKDLDSSYRDERLREVATLCDPRVRAAIEREGITLRSF